MLRYVASRIAMQVAVLIASTIIIFVLLHLAPGNPATLMNGGHPPSPATLRYFNKLYGFNRPLPVQYLIWLHNVLRGDLGTSVATRTSVASVIAPRIGLTLFLTIYAVAIMVVIGVPLGIISAVFRSGPSDFLASVGTLTFTAIPTYVTGVVMAVVFGVELAWFPPLGGGGTGSFLTRLDHLTLPAVALGLSSLALASRITRSAVIGELEKPHVTGARARGFSGPRVVAKHAVRGAMVPVVTIVGAQIGYLLGGAVVIEYAFGLNGLGTLLVSSVQGKDYAVVQAIALFITAEFLLISLVVDLLYGVIDPRVRLVGRTA
ncbi:MAG: ABC transporter permease [Acidimicrobiales bacterium]